VRGPHPETGKQLHGASVPDLGLGSVDAWPGIHAPG
jgi:hypothetical protein